MNKYLFTILVACLVLVSACNTNLGIGVTRGSGKLVTESRTVSNFHRVDLAGVGELNITQGDTEGLTIETDDNILPVVTTQVTDGTLRIGLDPNRNAISINPTRLVFTLQVKSLDSIQVSGAGNVTMPALRSDTVSIATSGAGNINFKQVETKTLTTSINGAGNIVLTGQAETQTANLTGLGNYNAGDLKSTNAAVNLSGAGNATLWASDSLNVQISGAGSVNYYGSPKVSQSISGVGSIKNLGNK